MGYCATPAPGKRQRKAWQKPQNLLSSHVEGPFKPLPHDRSTMSMARGNVLKLAAYTQGRQTACAFQDLLIQWIVVQRVRRDVGLAFMHCQILVAELLHIAELVGEQ